MAENRFVTPPRSRPSMTTPPAPGRGRLDPPVPRDFQPRPGLFWINFFFPERLTECDKAWIHWNYGPEIPPITPDPFSWDG